MTVEDRLMYLVANFIHGDENTLSPYDPLWTADGGALESDQTSEFLDELEGEFGIDVRERELGNVGSIQELLDLVQARLENARS